MYHNINIYSLDKEYLEQLACLTRNKEKIFLLFDPFTSQHWNYTTNFWRQRTTYKHNVSTHRRTIYMTLIIVLQQINNINYIIQ